MLMLQTVVDTVTAFSVEGDGVCLTCNMPKKAIVAIDGWSFSAQWCLASLALINLSIWSLSNWSSENAKTFTPGQYTTIKSQAQQFLIANSAFRGIVGKVRYCTNC